MEIESTVPAMVNEAGDVPLACIAEARLLAGRPREELEGAFGVEGVEDCGSGDGTMQMEIEITDGAFVARSDSYFLASITLEWKFRVLKFQLVLWVAEVRYLAVFHVFFSTDAASYNVPEQALYRAENYIWVSLFER